MSILIPLRGRSRGSCTPAWLRMVHAWTLLIVEVHGVHGVRDVRRVAWALRDGRDRDQADEDQGDEDQGRYNSALSYHGLSTFEPSTGDICNQSNYEPGVVKAQRL